ncbi:twin-arginine translocase TatA/TatE family subunit [Altererythrobacter sp. ZODW24]|uniref:twin-arginine translocase TatA/TatE family subunit n=1 Tax=Altererythrobacter sp. ZODW24 TaxID=2185142 RepID=UPI000DF8365E|nr:twin-arginine translocase TatA/TatE family subunit [Altererythrobacter sp. ZODW24]
MGLSVWQLLIVAIVILVLFGRGKISEMMGEFGKGIKSFKTGMAEEENEKPAEPAPRISHDAKGSSETSKDKSSDSAN